MTYEHFKTYKILLTCTLTNDAAIYIIMMKFTLEGREFIELNKLLKVLDLVSTGGEANQRIEKGEVLVNDAVETQKRKKLRAGDKVLFQKYAILIQ